MAGDSPFNTLRRLGNGLALATVASLVVGTACAAGAQTASGASPDPAVDSEAVAPPAARRGRIELRRQNTDRGSAEESTKTTLRLETALDGAVSRLRLDLQFPDEKADFQGDPFQPRLGDVKLRAYFRPLTAMATQVVPDIELTFPTADPASLGGGKYQFSAALHSVPGQPDVTLGDGRHQIRYEWDVRQTVSITGDPSRKDVNTTRPELALRDAIGSAHWLKLTFKPTIDWVQGGRTGAVLELEGGWNPSRDWRFSLMGGAGLWGEGISGSYKRRIELVAGRAF